MSRFMLNMIDDETLMDSVTPEEMEKVVAEMGDYNKQLEDAGVWVQGDGLYPSGTAKTLRYGAEGDVVVTDGPFAETKEQVAGFWIIECKDVDEAVSWAKKIPIESGTVEVRQIAETVEENLEAFQDQAGSN